MSRALRTHAMTTLMNNISFFDNYIIVVFQRIFGSASAAVVHVVIAHLVKVL